MPISMLFWAVYILSIVFSGAWFFREPAGRWGAGASFIVYVLIGLLGWVVFGHAIKAG